MSRTISNDILTKLASKELQTFWLFEFDYEGTSTKRFTNADVAMYEDPEATGTDEKYEPVGLMVDTIVYSKGNIVDSASITIDNINSVMTLYFGGTSQQGNDARLYYGVMNTRFETLGIVKVFEGEIDAWSLDEERLELTIASPFTKWSGTNVSRHPSLCRYKRFKGPRCKYSGSYSTCNRTYANCRARGNTANFGGFRFLPEIEDKVIWWGPTPDERRDELS